MSEANKEGIYPDNLSISPANHTYSLGHIFLYIQLVLSPISFRGGSRCMGIFFSIFCSYLPVPSWYTGRLWLLRLGLYELTREKEKSDDWVWIIDHTVQIGIEKCFAILGIRLCNLPARGTALSHKDVELIDLLPVNHSNGPIVSQQLENTIEKTGVPREIISDHGPDIKAGVEQFTKKHRQTSFIYDIKHMTAGILKHEFQEDETWKEFLRSSSVLKKRIQQTDLAPLSPPNQRSKSRYMNIDIMVRWGVKILGFLDRNKTDPNPEFDAKKVEEKFNWIRYYRKYIAEWNEVIRFTTKTEQFVRTQGLYLGCDIDLNGLLDLHISTDRSKRVRKQLLKFVHQESLKAKPNERLLGSDEILESIYGKLKRLEQDQSRSGFTVLILSIGAMISTLTTDLVQKAMEAVSTNDLVEWGKKNLGVSVQSKRKKALAPSGDTG